MGRTVIFVALTQVGDENFYPNLPLTSAPVSHSENFGFPSRSQLGSFGNQAPQTL